MGLEVPKPRVYLGMVGVRGPREGHWSTLRAYKYYALRRGFGFGNWWKFSQISASRHEPNKLSTIPIT